MTARTSGRCGLALLLALALPAAARAQQNRRVISGVEYRAMSFDPGLGYTKVSEFVVPVGVIWTVSPRLTFDVGTRFASASSTTAPDTAGRQVTATLSGLTDTQARLVYQVRPDMLALSLTANIPTGKSLLSSDQLGVAGPIAHDLIPYPVSNFGSGTSVTTGLALAVPVGGWAVGIGGAFRMSSGYTMFYAPDSSHAPYDLKPGAEMRFTLGADRVFGDAHASFGLTYSSFANDEVAGQQLAPGKRVIGQASWSQPFLGANLALYAWDLYRGASNDMAGAAAIQEQNLVAVGGALTIQQGRNQLRPSVEYRRHWAGFNSLQAEGTLLALGLRYAMMMGDRMTLLPAVRYDMGNVVGLSGTDVGYHGLSASLMLRTAW